MKLKPNRLFFLFVVYLALTSLSYAGEPDAVSTRLPVEFVDPLIVLILGGDNDPGGTPPHALYGVRLAVSPASHRRSVVAEKTFLG